jgi:ankyrin repeat protein
MVDRPTPSRKTPLMLATSSGDTEVMKLLLKAGASANAVDLDGRSALFSSTW